MATRKKMPRSLRKYIRREKARIRREFFDVEKQKQEIDKLYQRFFKKQKQQKHED